MILLLILQVEEPVEQSFSYYSGYNGTADESQVDIMFIMVASLSHLFSSLWFEIA